MSERDDGGPAFPSGIAADSMGGLNFSSQFPDAGGMSLRQWYAGQALGIALKVWESHDDPFRRGEKGISVIAFEIADAMIAEGKK